MNTGRQQVCESHLECVNWPARPTEVALCAGLTDWLFLPHFPCSSFFLIICTFCQDESRCPLRKEGRCGLPPVAAPLAQGKELACFVNFTGVSHFLPSNCSTGQELGQLSTEATSGAEGEICPDNNKGDKTVSRLT